MLLTGYDRELEAGDVGLHGIDGFFSSLASGLKSGVGKVFSAGVDVAKNVAYTYAVVKPPAGGGGGPQIQYIPQQQIQQQQQASGGMLGGLPKWALPVGGLALAGVIFMAMRKPKAAHNPRRRRKARKARARRRGRR